MVVDGGDGNDTITASSGDDYLDGGDGDDIIFGGPGRDILVSNVGDDSLSGGVDDDEFRIGGFSDKTLIDDSGIDSIDFSQVPASSINDEGVTLDLALDAGEVQAVRSDGNVSLTGTFENVTGTSFRDDLRGNNQDNLLFGGPGDDSVTGGDGNDMVYGGDGDDIVNGGGGGNDLIFGGPGQDVVTGGDGNDMVYGGEGDDVVSGGGSGNDLIFGGPGQDNVSGGDGNDMVYGGEGDDIINGGGSGNDLIFGGSGDDTVTGGDGNDVVYGDEGDDTFIGSAGNDLIFGGPGSDTVIGGEGNEIVYGGAGDDNIDGSEGNDLIFGGSGDDTVTGGDGNAAIYGEAGDDTLEGGEGNDLIFGGPGEDIVSGGEGNDIVYGGGGDDNITSGSEGNDLIFGGPGDDTVTGGDGNELVYGGDGDDGISSGGGNDLIFGGVGDDTVNAGDGNDAIYGDQGRDIISAGEGNDLIFGGPGDDDISAGDGNDMVFGGSGNDSITGGAEGNDLIFGGTGDDTVTGGDGNEVVYGEAGDDFIRAGDGNDLIFGGPGIDDISGGDGNDAIYGDDGDDVVTGSWGNDLIFGGPGDDTVNGGEGNEVIHGGIGDDLIAGGNGNDIIFGGPGNDDLNGGDGNDAIYGDSGDDRITGSWGNDLIFGGLGDDTITGGEGNEVIIGQEGDDIATGGGGNDLLFGGEGNDQLSGGAGNDAVHGDAGDDTIDGSSGIDVIFGGDGDDSITGGDGQETIFGGLGDDSIVASIGTDILVGGPGSDTFLLTTAVISSDESVTIFGGEQAASDTDPDRLIGLTDTNLTLTNTTIRIGGLGDVNFSDIQNARLIGSPNDNILDASAFSGDVVMIGGAGNDQLIGGGGNDDLSGGDGNNQLIGGAGDDIVRFEAGDQGNQTVVEANGGGFDTLDFRLLNSSLTIDLALSSPQEVSAGLFVTLVDPGNFEGVVGTPVDDQIRGNAANNRLVGLGGLDLLDGRAGDDVLEAGGQRLVLLDFDSQTDAEDHVYTQAERDAILQRLRSDFELFDISIEIADGTSALPVLPFVTVIFNAGIANDREDNVVVGGVAPRIGFRELAEGGTVLVNAGSFIRPDESPQPQDNRLPGTPENFIALSSTIAGHELGHTFGVRHLDSHGLVGEGVYDRTSNRGLLPSINLPTNADLTSEHLIASPNSVGTTMANAFGNPRLGTRGAIKFAFAESGRAVVESDSEKQANPNFSDLVQSLGVLPSLSVPQTDPLQGDDYHNVSAISVIGQIEQPVIGQPSESDFYSFVGSPGDLLTIEVLNQTIRHRVDRIFDTVIRLYGPDGQVVEYQGDSVYGAFNDNAFETIDALLFDFQLPPRSDGTTSPAEYTIEVDTFSFDLPELNLPNVPSYIGNFDVDAFRASNPDHPAVLDNDFGSYELFVYRYDGTTSVSGGGSDRLIGGPGADQLRGTSANETLVGFNDVLGDTFVDPSGEVFFEAGLPSIDPPLETTLFMDEGGLLVLDLTATDPDSETLDWSIEPVDILPYPTGASITSTGAKSATLDWTAFNNGTFHLRIVAKDGDDQTDSVELTIEVSNLDPIAEIDFITPSPVVEGTEVFVTVSATDPAGINETLSYNFSVFLDNVFVTGITGESLPEFQFIPEDEGSYDILVEVSDGDGGIAIDSETVVVTNANPTIDSFSIETDRTVGEPVRLTASVSDLGLSDVLSARVRWEGGNSDFFFVPIIDGVIDVTYVYSDPGDYTVTLLVSDGVASTSDVRVTRVLEAISTLTISGTPEADLVYVDQTIDSYRIFTKLDGWQTYLRADYDEVVIDVGDGDDRVRTSPKVTDPIVILGGAGNDVLIGGSGPDTIDGGPDNDTINGQLGNDRLIGGDGDDRVSGGGGDDLIRGGIGADIALGGDGKDIIVGGAGVDLLLGGSGRDFVIGGLGGDRLSGQAGEDILIGGFTIYDDDDVALASIMLEWTSERTYLNRIDNLGTLSTSDYPLGFNAIDDGASDWIHGSYDRDWFFALLDDENEDELPDRQLEEVIDGLLIQ
ncbi:MAG: PKD domain-containing protein [Planctomycetota bacterium]